MVLFQDISVGDKELINRYLKAKCYENSEYNFTNLLMWTPHYSHKYTIMHDSLCVIGKYRNKYPFAYNPWSDRTPDYTRIIPSIAEAMTIGDYPLVLKHISEDIKNEIESVMPDRIIFREDRSNFDYVYLAKDLINLIGSKYHQKRNHINRFVKRYAYSYEEINESNLEECIKAQAGWRDKRGRDSRDPEEQDAIGQILKHNKYLDLKGGALRVNGSIVAFSIGELLNPDMAVIHLEKANVRFRGSYSMINQQFAENAWSNVKYINREEDMGLYGLRKAKSSYHPVKMVKKYIGFYIE